MNINEEKYINDRVGRRTPFKVPNGYFEAFTDKMTGMLQMYDNSHLDIHHIDVNNVHKFRISRLHPWLAVAACTLAIVCGVSVYLSQDSTSDSSINTGCHSVSIEQTAQHKQLPHPTYMEAAANYTMTDNEDIYACLTDD